jgi:hypothetical protein
MDKKEFDINNPTPQDFMEMATYVAMSEKKNVELLEELKKTKAYLTATIQQRNSAEARYQNLLAQKTQHVINLGDAVVINTKLDTI